MLPIDMHKLHISNSFFLLLAILLLVDKDGTAFLFLLAALLHEMGHYFILRCCGGTLTCMQITGVGAVMRYRLRACTWQRCCIAAAGPLSSICLAFIAAKLGFYRFSGANALLGLFNLLPIYPLDGSVLLCTILYRFPTAYVLCSRICAVLLMLFGVLLSSKGYGISLCILAGVLLTQQQHPTTTM